MAEKRRHRNRDLVLEEDGSYRFKYRGRTYAMRLRRHLETDTWEVVSIWSVASQRHIPLVENGRRNRWEALLAGELSRSVQEARHAAERDIEAWLRRDEAGSRSQPA